VGYCLLGLFEVNMPLLYGEGGAKAFKRLQEEILKKTRDQSFLAWSEPKGYDDPDILANHPRCFRESGDIRASSEDVPPFSMNNYGLRIRLPMVQIHDQRGHYIAVLACVRVIIGVSARRICIRLRATDRDGVTLVRNQIGFSPNLIYEEDIRRASIRDR
jgi:hypothetical protein